MKQGLCLLILLIFLVSSFLVSASGLGIAPATLEFKDALKGAITQKQLSIQNPGDEPIIATIEVSGDLAEWLTLSSSSIEVPAQGTAYITFSLNPPEDAEDKEYTGKIAAKAQSSAAIEGSGMGLMPGVNSDIIATVTNKRIIKGEVTKILTKDENYGAPILFTIGFENHGNVAVGPDVIIEINQGAEGVIDTIQESLELIEPGASKDYKVEVPSMDKDKNTYYRATVTISLDGEIIEQKENVGFRILDPSQPLPTTVNKVSDDKNSVVPGIIVTVSIIILGLIIYLIFRKK